MIDGMGVQRWRGHWEGLVRLLRVAGLQDDARAQGTALGEAAYSLAVLATEGHLEVSLCLQHPALATKDSKWAGFYFCGQLQHLAK